MHAKRAKKKDIEEEHRQARLNAGRVRREKEKQPNLDAEVLQL